MSYFKIRNRAINLQRWVKNRQKIPINSYYGNIYNTIILPSINSFKLMTKYHNCCQPEKSTTTVNIFFPIRPKDRAIKHWLPRFRLILHVRTFKWLLYMIHDVITYLGLFSGDSHEAPQCKPTQNRFWIREHPCFKHSWFTGY